MNWNAHISFKEEEKQYPLDFVCTTYDIKANIITLRDEKNAPIYIVNMDTVRTIIWSEYEKS